MTHNDFFAWMKGFMEAAGDKPTPEQWQKLKRKMAEADSPIPFPCGNPPVEPWPSCPSPSVPTYPRYASPDTTTGPISIPPATIIC